MKSPLRYPGGKSRLIKILKDLVPENYIEYRELFVGGGSFFFHEKETHPSKKFWINDLYEPLINFWVRIRDEPEPVIKKIVYYKHLFEDGKDLFFYLRENYDNLNQTDKAAAFFVFNRITFSGTTDSGGYSNESFHKRFTKSSIERLEKIIPQLKDVKITNENYKDIINDDGEKVFLFLDPPYYSATKSGLYGKKGNLHKNFNHEEFAKIIKTCKHDYLITYDNCDYIKNLFSFANITPVTFAYGMKNSGIISNQIGNEILISNYLNKDNVNRVNK